MSSRLTYLCDVDRVIIREEQKQFHAPLVAKESLTKYKATLERRKSGGGVRTELLYMLPMAGKAYLIVGIVEIEKASIDHLKAGSTSADVGATLQAADVALAAALTPVTLGDVGDIELERNSARS